MNNLQIIADGFELDSNNVTISINYTIDDIFDLSKRNTSFSKTIEIVGTPKNNIFFKQIFDVNIDRINFNVKKAIPVVLRIDDNQLINGNLQLLEIVKGEGEVIYQVQVTGRLKNLLESFGDDNLRDLDFSEYNHIRTKEAITNSWDYVNILLTGSTSYGGPGKGYVYPYIITGNRDDIQPNLLVGDSYPALYLKEIWDKMFESINMTYTSNFISSLNNKYDNYFSKLILPYVGDKIQKTAEVLLEEKVIVGIETNANGYAFATQEQARDTDWWYNSSINYSLGGLTKETGSFGSGSTQVDLTDLSDQWDNDIYTCKNAGYYNISFDGKLLGLYRRTDGNDIEYKSGSFEYSFELQKVKVDGTIIVLDSSVDPDDPNANDVLLFSPSAGIHTSPWLDIDNPLQCNPSADNVYLEVGEKVRFKLGFKYPKVKWQGGFDGRHKAGLVFKQSLNESPTIFKVVQATNDSTGNDLMNLNSILNSKIKLKDLFLDVIKMFNLVVQDNPDKPNDVIIEPRDDFYKSRQRVVDWTQLVDRESIKLIPMSEIDATTYLYKYTDDSDYYNTEYLDETKKSFGELSFDVNNDFSNKTDETKIKSFSPTPNADKWTNGRVAPYFADFQDGIIKPKKVKSRILFYGGRVASEAFYLKDDDGDIGDVQYSYAYAGMWDHPTNPKWDLAFGRTDKLYYDFDVIPNANLFELFHKATLNNIININSTLLEGIFKLTPKDIANFDFRDIIFIDGAYWRVNTIKDYNPTGSDSLTKVQLYKIIDVNILSPYQVEVPQSNANCPIDMVVVNGNKYGKNTGKYYISTSGQEITADCCKSIGGTFKNGVCYSTNSNPTIGNMANSDIKRINNGQNVFPISDGFGPTSTKKNNNTINTLGVRVYGKGNYVPKDGKNGLIIGNNNSINKNVVNSVVIGDGITADSSGVIYIGDIKIDQTGNITPSGINIIDGGADTTIGPFNKVNTIDIIDGGKDSVRNYGGASKSRPIIDGNDK